ncbi:hypothetical protein Tco_1526323 [Tanacetum coccineum]
MISILVTPRVSALVGYDRLVSELGYREVGGAFRGTKGGRLVEESEKEVDSDLLSDARSRPGPAESGDFCERKVEPKRGPP